MVEPSVPELSQQWSALVRLVRRRKWVMLTFLTMTLLVVAVGTTLQTPIYRATATVLIDMETPTVLGVSVTRDDFTLGPSSYQTYADYYRTQLEIITSRAIAQRVFDDLRLSEHPAYADAPDPVGALLGHVAVEPVKQTRLVKIHVEHPNPELAAQTANAFAAVLAEENLARARAAEVKTLLKHEYLKLQSKEADLSKRYKAKHPAMIRIRQEMDHLARMIEQELARYEARRQGGPAAEEALTRSTLEQLKEPSLLGSFRPNNIRVQDHAQPPTKPFRPKTALSLLLGLVLGLLGGVGFAVTQELIDNSVKTPEDVEQDHRLVLLGYVPRIDGGRPGRPHQPPQQLQLDPHSHAAEAYRALRTSLFYATPQDNSHAIVVTSAGSAEGKTTTVSNLGVTLAQSGVKVLLVDADMRKGRLHEMFQLNQSPGLSELLIGQASVEAVLQPTGIDGLAVVASGVYPPNPAELLDSKSMREFLGQVSTRFDRVLLDSPPVIPITDAVILAAMTETVIAVAQSGRTPRQALHRLTTLCHEVRAKVLGIILNNVPPRDAPAYYSYSAYRYGSAQDGRQPPNDAKARSRLRKLLRL